MCIPWWLTDGPAVLKVEEEHEDVDSRAIWRTAVPKDGAAEES